MLPAYLRLIAAATRLLALLLADRARLWVPPWWFPAAVGWFLGLLLSLAFAALHGRLSLPTFGACLTAAGMCSLGTAVLLRNRTRQGNPQETVDDSTME